MRTCLVAMTSSVIRKVARRFGRAGFPDHRSRGPARRRWKVASAPAEAILLDWNMPVMDGYEFLAICAACPGRRRAQGGFCTTRTMSPIRAPRFMPVQRYI